jgi:hypothetical protein
MIRTMQPDRRAAVLYLHAEAGNHVGRRLVEACKRPDQPVQISTFGRSSYAAQENRVADRIGGSASVLLRPRA